jgi:hypothetical protein
MMARLIDDIRAARQLEAPFWLDQSRSHLWNKHAERIMKTIHEGADIPILLIDNVAEYYFSGTDQEHWDLKDHFPNLAPPYPIFWTEHKLPKTIHSREFGTTSMTTSGVGPKARTGILWMASTDFRGEGIPANVKWAMLAEVFIDYDARSREIEGPAGTWIILIDEHGVIVECPLLQGYTRPEWNEIIRGFVSWLHPALLAVSFLHCRNVKLIDNEPDKPLAKKYHARTGVWPAKYHTLEIEPLKQILRRDGRSDAVGVAKAMHVCRGHFKDYREGRGLFGKYHQLVWQPALVRGTKGDTAPPREIRIKV